MVATAASGAPFGISWPIRKRQTAGILVTMGGGRVAGQVDGVVGDEQRRSIDQHEIGEAPCGAEEVASMLEQGRRVLGRRARRDESNTAYGRAQIEVLECRSARSPGQDVDEPRR